MAPAFVRERSGFMKLKKQIVIGSAILIAATAVCYNLAYWAGEKIKKRKEKGT